MNPIINHELGKALHKEREAEFARHWHFQVSEDAPQRSPKNYHVLTGLGSIIMSGLIIVQMWLF